MAMGGAAVGGLARRPTMKHRGIPFLREQKRAPGRSSGKTQFGCCRLADDPPQFDSPRIEYLALLRYPGARGEVVDLAGDSWQRLAVLVLVRLMVEAERDTRLRQA